MAVFISNKIEKKKVLAPASKSFAQRILLASSLGTTIVRVINTGNCEDVLNILAVMKGLGAEVSSQNDISTVFPRKNEPIRELNCGESGLGIRLTTPIASTFGGNFLLKGKGSLLKRPLSAFLQFLPEMGVNVELTDDFLPMQIEGKLKGGNYSIDGSVSSQYISGLLMALPLCQEDSKLTVFNSKSTPYIDMTLEVLDFFGIEIENENYQIYKIKGGQNYQAKSNQISVEGDWSGASFWVVFGLMNGGIRIKGLNPFSSQADKEILTVVEQIGASFSWDNDVLDIRSSFHKPFSFDATNCPDLFPALVVLSASIEGVSKIKGVHRLKYKESNRAEVLIKEFGSLGLKMEIVNDEIVVEGTGRLKSGIIHANNDHRIAMAGAIASLLTPEGITVEDENSVNKSYPNFWKEVLNE